MADAGTGAFEGFGRRVDARWGRAEGEVRRFLGYVNDEVVPVVRRSSAAALRAGAAELQRLADALDPEARVPPGEPTRG